MPQKHAKHIEPFENKTTILVSLTAQADEVGFNKTRSANLAEEHTGPLLWVTKLYCDELIGFLLATHAMEIKFWRSVTCYVILFANTAGYSWLSPPV